MKARLAEEVVGLTADDSVRVIVLTGSSGYFVAGSDIAGMASLTPTQHVTLATDHVFNVMRHCPKPLVAALEGYAPGGGCELACLESAQFSCANGAERPTRWPWWMRECRNAF